MPYASNLLTFVSSPHTDTKFLSSDSMCLKVLREPLTIKLLRYISILDAKNYMYHIHYVVELISPSTDNANPATDLLVVSSFGQLTVSTRARTSAQNALHVRHNRLFGQPARFAEHRQATTKPFSKLHSYTIFDHGRGH